MIDFGVQECGQTATTRIELANLGDEDLTITGVRTSCSCSGLEIERDGTLGRVERLTLAPAERRQLVVRQTVNGQPGESFKSAIYLTTTAAEQAEVVLPIVVSRLKGGLEVYPNAVTFGRRTVGSILREVILVVDRDPNPRKVSRVSLIRGGRSIKATLLPPDPVSASRPDGGTVVGRVEVLVDTSEPQTIDDREDVWCDGGPSTASISVLISGSVTPAVVATPGAVTLPLKSEAGAVFRTTCLFHSADGGPFHLRVVSCPHGWQVNHPTSDDATGTRRVELELLRDAAGKPRPATNRGVVQFEAQVGEKVVPIQVEVMVRVKEDGP